MSWQVALIITSPQLVAALTAAWYARRTHRSVSQDVTPQLTEATAQLADVQEQVHSITNGA